MPAVQNVLALTRDLLRFNTINPPGDEAACAQFLGKLLSDAGYRVSYHDFLPNRTTVIAEIGGQQDKPPICFTGHIDVVPLGAKPWQYDPFAGELDGDRIYGRGSTDMKGGVAAFIDAAIKLAPHLQRSPGLKLVLTAGEEINCEGARYVSQHQLLGRAGAVVIAEPTANRPLVGHKGVCWVEVEALGKTAHGSMPEQGDNAIVKLAPVIDKLARFDFQAVCGCAFHPILGKPTLNIGTVSGGLNTNSVPDSARLSLDIRTIPGIEHERMVAAIQQLVDPAQKDVKVRRLFDAPSMYTDPSDEWVQSVFDVTSEYLGVRPEPATITFSTDGPHLKSGFEQAMGKPVPTLVLGPGEPEMAHQTDEYLSLAKTEASSAMFAAIIERWQVKG
jgi:succinyl-diaminopimelate desuccinylase